jgi:hypothetical protein
MEFEISRRYCQASEFSRSWTKVTIEPRGGRRGHCILLVCGITDFGLSGAKAILLKCAVAAKRRLDTARRLQQQAALNSYNYGVADGISS